MAWGQQDAGLFLLALAEVPQVMSAFAPSPFTARTFSDKPEKIKELKKDLIAGSVVSVGIGLAIASITSRQAPFWGAVLVLGIFLAWYWRAMQYAQKHGAQSMKLDMPVVGEA